MSGEPPCKADQVLDPAERAQLQSMVRSRSITAALRARAQIVLASAGGEPNSSIAARLGYTNATVGKWRRRLVERRINGLYDELRPVSRGRTQADQRRARDAPPLVYLRDALQMSHR